MEKPNESQLIHTILAWTFCAALGSYLCMYIAEPDVFFHLTVGAWIRSHHAVPSVDLWSQALAGKPWIDQSWLFQVVLSALESSFGWEGLICFKLALCVLTVTAIFYSFASAAQERMFAAFVATMCACGVLEQSPLSPELVVWLLLPCCLALGNRGASPKTICAALGVGALLGNIQPAWLLGIAAISMLLAVRWTIVVGYLAGALCSPFFGAQFLSAIKETVAYAQFGLETQASLASIFDFRTAFLILVWALLALLARISLQELPRKPLRAAIVLSLLSLLFSSLLAAALILTGWALCAMWPLCSNSQSPLVTAIRGLERFLSKLPVPGTLWLLFCVFLVNSINAYRIPLIDIFLPVKETDYIVENNLPPPLWHESAVGPYLAYRFSDALGEPRRQIRLDIRSLPYERQRFVDEYRQQWQTAFEQEKPQTVLVRSNAPEYAALSRDSRYKKIEPLSSESGDPEAAHPRRKLTLSWALFVRTIE